MIPLTNIYANRRVVERESKSTLGKRISENDTLEETVLLLKDLYKYHAALDTTFGPDCLPHREFAERIAPVIGTNHAMNKAERGA